MHAEDEIALGRLVTQAFSRRRKTLRNAFEGLLDETGIREAGLDPDARPETVDVAGFVQASNLAVRRLRDAG
jgi:16S rRNA (adenine1518-N6/adenine1519-N6)-dimethyltransferase